MTGTYALTELSSAKILRSLIDKKTFEKYGHSIYISLAEVYKNIDFTQYISRWQIIPLRKTGNFIY